MNASGSPAVPAWLRTAWRGGLFLALAGFFTVAAMVMRGLVGGFGLEPWPLLLAGAAALLTGVLLIAPLAPLIDLPEAIVDHWLPERRTKRGGCPSCGYDAIHRSTRTCSECGAPVRVPVPYAVTWSTLRRGMALVLPAWLLGCAVGFTVLLRDEHAFTVEVQAQRSRAVQTRAPQDAITRRRMGVAGFSPLRWTAREGFTGPPPYEFPKLPLPARRATSE